MQWYDYDIVLLLHSIGINNVMWTPHFYCSDGPHTVPSVVMKKCTH